MLHYRSIRIVHFWTTLFIITPLLIFTLLRTIRLFQENRTNGTIIERTGQTPALFFSSMLDTINSHSELEVSDWTDIKSVAIKPGTGVAHVDLGNSQRVELDLFTGEIIQVSRMHSDIINGLSNRNSVEYIQSLFLYLAIIALIFIHVFTGIYLFLRPQIIKLRKKKLLAEEALLME